MIKDTYWWDKARIRSLHEKQLIYQFQCQKDECKHLQLNKVRYSGLTRCTLSRRLSYHLQNGAIKEHAKKHTEKITREEIVKFTEIRYRENDIQRLEILEALIILDEDPEINHQDTGKTKILKLYGNGQNVTSNINWRQETL